MPQLNFNALASGGPQSVYEGFMQGQEIRNKLAQQEQARQLTDIQRQHATLQLQNATREQQAADEESAAWKAGAGDPRVVLQQLQQRGLGKSAMALQGQMTKQQSDKLAQQKATVDLIKHAANRVFADPGSALQILQSFGQRTGVDMSDDIAEVQRLGGDLEAVKRWAAGQAFEADKLWPKFQTIDQNDKKTVQGFDPVTGQPVGPGTVYSAGMSPAQIAQNKIAQGQLELQERRFAYQKEQDVKEALDKVASNALDAPTIDFLAQQVLAGDKAVLTGLAREKGAVAAVRNRVTQLATTGQISPQQASMAMAEFGGTVAGERVLGTQAANINLASNEASKMIGLVKDLSGTIDRTQFPTVNAIQNAISKGTGDAKIVKLNAALNSLVNVYARAISPRGVPTVSDKTHAREMINAAYADNQIAGITDIMEQEMAFARESPEETKKAMRRYHTGVGEKTPAPAATRPSLDSIFGRPK